MLNYHGTIWDLSHLSGRTAYYSVYFEVTRQKRRRFLLRVQSACLRAALSQRERAAKPVRLNTLRKAALEGRRIKP